MNNKRNAIEECTVEEIEAFLKVSMMIIDTPEKVKQLPINHGIRPRVQMVLRMLRAIMTGKSNTLANVVHNGGMK